MTSHFSCVWLFETLWTVTCQVPLSMWILQARILAWVSMPFSRGSSPSGIECRSPALQVDSLPSETPGKPDGTAVVMLYLSNMYWKWFTSSWHHIIITKPSRTVTNVISPGPLHGPFRQWLFLDGGSSGWFYSQSHLLFECSIWLQEPNHAHRIPTRFLQKGKPTPTPELMNPSCCQL